MIGAPSSIEEALHDLACSDCGALGLCACGDEDPTESADDRCRHGVDGPCVPCLAEYRLTLRRHGGAPDLLPELDSVASSIARLLVGDALDVVPSEHESVAHARWLEWVTPKLRYTCDQVAALYPGPEERARLFAEKQARMARFRARHGVRA